MKALLRSSLLACVALFVLQLNEAFACSCNKFTPCEAFNYADAVFIGKVVGGTTKVKEYSQDGKTYSMEAGEVRVLVEESFKGVAETEVIVTGFSSMCGPEGLVRGGRYVIYTRQQGSSIFYIGPCSPTRAVEYAKEDLDFLHSLPKPGVGGRVFGHVGVDLHSDDNPPLAGVKVVVSNGQHSYEAVTNANGDYEIKGVIPGEYKAAAQMPPNYTCDYPDRDLLVTDRGCAQASYWVKMDSSLSGRVVDIAGHPAPATITLRSLANKERTFRDYAQEDGEFEIVGVEPGRYLLFLDIYSAGKEKFSGKEDLYYYPGTFDRERATIIEIRTGEKLNGYTARLPEKLRAYSIRGVVETPDGKPVAKARVILSITDKTTPNVYRTDDWGTGNDTDAGGRFEFVGFAGNTYSIYAREDALQAYQEKRPPRFSEKVALKLGKEVDELKLVLTTTTDPDRVQPPQKAATPTPPKQ
jgi:hypothetical protein